MLTVSQALTQSAGAPLRFSIPHHDLDCFAFLNDQCRLLVKLRLKALEIIHRRGGSLSACETIAAQFHVERGWSAKTLHRLYLDLIRSRDWRCLVDAAKAGPAWQNNGASHTLPAEFIAWLCGQAAFKQRGKFRSAFTQLRLRLERWRAGDASSALPGYQEPPPPGISRVYPDLPHGWEESNLRKIVNSRLSAHSKKLIRLGPKAASNLAPFVLSTRVGSAVGRHYILDDSWNDFKVLAYGQCCRLLAFHVLDLFSGCNLARGYKPALKDEQQVEERLKEKEMVWLLVKLLTTDGYHPSGTQIICEKATAAVREREREILADCGIPITVHDGPAGGGPGIAGLFTGPGGGNPRWKAPLESWFNLLRNRTDDLLDFPGQTGSNARLNCPEGLPGLERDTLALVKAMRALPPEKAELLRLGLLNHHEAIFKLDAVTEVINCRIDHALEGWRQCGHVIEEFRVNPRMAWQPTAALLDFDPADRAAISAVLASSSVAPVARLTRERALSPREVFDAGRSSLTRLPLSVAALLLADLEPREITVKNGRLAISVPDVDPDEPLLFGLMRRDGRGLSDPLRNDEKFAVIVNPLDPRVAWLYSADKQFVGVADYYGRARRDDPAALQHAFSAKRAALAPLLAEARRLAAPITQAALDRTAHNATILGPTPKTKAAQKQRQADADDARETLMHSML